MIRKAEHLMLVDLARNDIGKVCEIGSVHAAEFMTIERYSHVMHIVSEVVGKLASDKNAFDLMRATFPAGTVSGAPKVRAMQIIAEQENFNVTLTLVHWGILDLKETMILVSLFGQP